MRNHFQQFSVINEREQTTKRSQQNCFLRKAVAVSIWDQFLLSEGARIAAFFTNVLAPNYHLATRYPTKSIIGQQLPGEFMTLNPSSPNTFSFAHWLPIEHKQQKGAKEKNKAKSTICFEKHSQFPWAFNICAQWAHIFDTIQTFIENSSHFS